MLPEFVAIVVVVKRLLDGVERPFVVGLAVVAKAELAAEVGVVVGFVAVVVGMQRWQLQLNWWSSLIGRVVFGRDSVEINLFESDPPELGLLELRLLELELLEIHSLG